MKLCFKIIIIFILIKLFSTKKKPCYVTQLDNDLIRYFRNSPDLIKKIAEQDENPFEFSMKSFNFIGKQEKDDIPECLFLDESEFDKWDIQFRISSLENSINMIKMFNDTILLNVFEASTNILKNGLAEQCRANRRKQTFSYLNFIVDFICLLANGNGTGITNTDVNNNEMTTTLSSSYIQDSFNNIRNTHNQLDPPLLFLNQSPDKRVERSPTRDSIERFRRRITKAYLNVKQSLENKAKTKRKFYVERKIKFNFNQWSMKDDHLNAPTRTKLYLNNDLAEDDDIEDTDILFTGLGPNDSNFIGVTKISIIFKNIVTIIKGLSRYIFCIGGPDEKNCMYCFPFGPASENNCKWFEWGLFNYANFWPKNFDPQNPNCQRFGYWVDWIGGVFEYLRTFDNGILICLGLQSKYLILIPLIFFFAVKIFIILLMSVLDLYKEVKEIEMKLGLDILKKKSQVLVDNSFKSKEKIESLSKKSLSDDQKFKTVTRNVKSIQQTLYGLLSIKNKEK